MSDRLDSWKDICAYLGRDRRTLQRWEQEHGLPIHRVPGGAKPRVYALRPELDTWLRSGRLREAPAAAETLPPSVAVLPFANLTGEKESEYFGDGLADDLINALTRVPGLRVTARTSSFAFRGKDQDVREIGARLRAAALLEGSIRRSGSRIRISAQLVSATDGYHLWSETYDRELTDIFVIQDQIAHSMAAALSVRLAPRQLVRGSTADLEAYGLWLKGRSIALAYTPESMAQARECFEEALRRDPTFPEPYVSLAEMMWDLTELGLIRARTGLAQVRAGIDRALALDDTLGEAHALDGALHGLLDFDWAAAGRSFDRALEENPSSSTVLMRYAWSYLHAISRLQEAATVLRQALDMDPLSPFLHTAFGLLRMSERDHPGAAASFSRALEIHPGLWWPRFFLGAATLLAGDLARGVAICDAALRTQPGPVAAGAMAFVHGFAGNADESRRILAELLRANETAPVSPLAVAWACLGARDERVFEWLARTIDAREPAILHLPSMPIYDGIRGDPRFAALLRTMRLSPC